MSLVLLTISLGALRYLNEQVKVSYLLLLLILCIYFIITVQNQFTYCHSVAKMQTEATAVIKMVVSPFS